MIKNSLIVKITILFTVALFSLGSYSFYFIKTQAERDEIASQRKYAQFIATINQIMRYGGSVELIEKYLAELQFQKISEVLTPETHVGVSAEALHDSEGISLLLQNGNTITLYRDQDAKSNYKNYYVLTFFAFAIVVFLYALVLKSLLPLKKLRREIRKFANGSMDIQCKSTQEDEIGELANEFHNAVQKIASLNQSRHLFLRTIMHELKTPITKGRIVAEMVQSPLQKERLCSAFGRLNALIDEFAKIEELGSKNCCVLKKNYSLQTIVEHVFKLLLLENEQRESLFCLPKESLIVSVDFELFSLALKNLFDNALKYRSDGVVTLGVESDQLVVANQGASLPLPLDEYFKPFFKDEKNPHSQGFGLGLYIIKSTLEAQGIALGYEHTEGCNRFLIQGVFGASSNMG